VERREHVGIGGGVSDQGSEGTEPQRRDNWSTGTIWSPESAGMPATISHLTFDSLDAYAQSVFWGQVLGFVEDPSDPNEPGDEECMIFSPDDTQRLLFIEVPEPKAVKNRVHLDLRPSQGRRDEELTRLLSLGARAVDDRRNADGSGWVVLADPEGNEFCILRSQEELPERPQPMA
jgi:hypothetical protein